MLQNYKNKRVVWRRDHPGSELHDHVKYASGSRSAHGEGGNWQPRWVHEGANCLLHGGACAAAQSFAA